MQVACVHTCVRGVRHKLEVSTSRQMSGIELAVGVIRAGVDSAVNSQCLAGSVG